MSTTAEIPAATDPEVKRKIANRLRRAPGQLAAVIAAVDDDGDCRDVVQQPSAVSKAVDRAAFLAVAGALKECLADDAEDGDRADEVERLFLSLG